MDRRERRVEIKEETRKVLVSVALSRIDNPKFSPLKVLRFIPIVMPYNNANLLSILF